MENSTNRFADPGFSLGEIATHFVVHCPKCNGKALIVPQNQYHRLTCTQCFHVDSLSTGMVLRRLMYQSNAGNAGHLFSAARPGMGNGKNWLPDAINAVIPVNIKRTSVNTISVKDG